MGSNTIYFPSSGPECGVHAGAGSRTRVDPQLQDTVNLCQRCSRRFFISLSIGWVINGTLCLRISSHSYCNVYSGDFRAARLALAVHNGGKD